MYKNIVLLSCLYVLLISSVSAQQYKSISIEQATELALKQDPNIVLADLLISKSEILSSGAARSQATQIFFSGEEFNFEGISGIQSLNIQQTFNLPKVNTTYKNYHEAQMKMYEYQKKLTKKDIIRNVESAYYSLLIAKQELLLSQDAGTVYQDFLTRSKEAFEAGESNKVGMLKANTLLKKAKLDIDHATHEVEIIRELFNIWLGATGNYDVDMRTNEQVENWNKSENNPSPHLGIYQLQKELVESSIDMQKSQLLPKLNTALRLQSLNGDFFYFGYQLGVNIPLIKGGYNKQIEATKVSLDIADSEKRIKEREINLKTIKLKGHLEHLNEKIKAYDTDLLPSIKEELTLLKEAYQAGEGSYIEYMMSIESYINLQIEKVDLLRDFYTNYVELKYWSEVN